LKIHRAIEPTGRSVGSEHKIITLQFTQKEFSGYGAEKVRDVWQFKRPGSVDPEHVDGLNVVVDYHRTTMCGFSRTLFRM
jgi:hypothetical protein